MTVKIFVLGRPGSGKTTAMRRMHEIAYQWGRATRRVRDYEFLYEMFCEDVRKNGGRFRPTKYEGFDVLDMTAFDDALQWLESSTRKLLMNEALDMVTIEFARDDYGQALKNFSSDFLRDAYFFFVEADLETCINRIRQRIIFPSNQERPLEDCHYVSDYIMQTYYHQDCQEYVEKQLRQDFHLEKTIGMYRNEETLRDLYWRVDEFMSKHLSSELGLQELKTIIV